MNCDQPVSPANGLRYIVGMKHATLEGKFVRLEPLTLKHYLDKKNQYIAHSRVLIFTYQLLCWMRLYPQMKEVFSPIPL